MMLNAFGGRFRQVAYVTNDLDRALAEFAETGVRRFLQFREREFDIGRHAQVRCHIGMALSGGVEIEVIEPLGGADAIYRDVLSGPDFALRFHHVAYTLPSLEALTALKAEMRAGGLAIPVEGAAPEGVTYFYGDLRRPFGHYVEYVYGGPEYEAGMAAALPVN
jgi:hypothetical protein